MPDVVGYKAKVGLIVPSTNTVVEHDVWSIRPPGVTFHAGRFMVESPDLSTNEKFLHFLDLIRDTIPGSVEDVMTAKPDYIMMGMSAETFWGGKEGNEDFIARIDAITGGLGITTGASALDNALGKLGVNRIACITPYQTVGDEQVELYFTEMGYDVKRVLGLKCDTATSIADVTPAEVVAAINELNGPDVDAIVQCGTNLSMVGVADAAEQMLGKPVLAINAVCVWDTLRNLDIDDQFVGFGSMLRDF